MQPKRIHHDWHDAAHAAPPPPPPAVAADETQHLAIPSPAQALQGQVHAAFSLQSRSYFWTRRRAYAAMVFFCSMFWGGVLYSAFRLFG